MFLKQIAPPFIVLLVAGCVHIGQGDALRAAQTYSTAVSAGDVDALVAYTDPELLKRATVTELRAVMTSLFVEHDASIVSIRDAVGTISDSFVDSTGVHYFVDNRRTTVMKDGTRVEVDNYYLLTSRDFGRTWRVLDLGCVDEVWIRAIAPGWNGVPAVPKQDVRISNVEVQFKGAAPAGTDAK